MVPNSGTCEDPSKPKKIEERVYDAIIILRGKKQLNSAQTDEQRKEFPSKFNWAECSPNEDEQARGEHVSVK